MVRYLFNLSNVPGSGIDRPTRIDGGVRRIVEGDEGGEEDEDESEDESEAEESEASFVATMLSTHVFRTEV